MQSQDALRKSKSDENAAIASETKEQVKQLDDEKQNAEQERKRAEDELGYRSKAALSERQHADGSK